MFAYNALNKHYSIFIFLKLLYTLKSLRRVFKMCNFPNLAHLTESKKNPGRGVL